MSKYDKDYFFIRMDDDNECLPYLKPDINTNGRRFRDQAPLPGSAPFVFANAWKEDFQADRKTDDVAGILFESSNFLVRDRVRDKLLQYQIPNLYIHPSVYIDDRGNWHENYWFVGFTYRFDCWDREKSTYTSPPVQIGDKAFYDMSTYSLNETLLDETPLARRLLFQMGGTQDAMIVCHQSLASLFSGNGPSGAVLQAITDY